MRTAYPFIVPARLRISTWDRCSAGRNATLKGLDARGVGCAEATESGSSLTLVFLSLARESGQGKGGHTWKRKDVCCDH